MSLKNKAMKIEAQLLSPQKIEEEKLTDAEIITNLLIEEDNDNPYL